MININEIEEAKAFTSEILCFFQFKTKIRIEGNNVDDIIEKLNGEIFQRYAVEMEISNIMGGAVDFDRENIDLERTGSSTYEVDLVWSGNRNFIDVVDDINIVETVEYDINSLLPVFEDFLEKKEGFKLLNTSRASVVDVVKI